MPHHALTLIPRAYDGPLPSRQRRRLVLKRDRQTCAYCGARGIPLAVDHIRPRCHYPRGASPAMVNDPSNLVAACADCNLAKGGSDLDGFAAMLRGRRQREEVIEAMLARIAAARARPLPA